MNQQNSKTAAPARKRLFANSHSLQEEIAAAAATGASAASASAPASPSPLQLPSPSTPSALEKESAQKQFEDATAILESLYDLVKEKWPGFIARDGQRQMMNEALMAFLQAKDADDETRGENLATLEAGTGTGKTVAYCLAAIAASRVTGKKVVISTATVALQEQLVERDLPRLSEVLGGIEFQILKGRNRYVCKSKLDGAAENDFASYLFDEEEAEPAGKNEGFASVAKSLAVQFDSLSWNGEMDTLPQKLEPQDWRKIQADTSTCTNSKCDNFKKCAFYVARGKAKDVPILVGNHALVLSNLAREAKILKPSEHLFVFDEAHHLPDIAADQFATNARLGSTEKALSRAKTLLQKASKECAPEVQSQANAIGGLVSNAIERVRFLRNTFENSNLFAQGDSLYRFQNGLVPESLAEQFTETGVDLTSVLNACQLVQADLRGAAEDVSPSERAARAKLEGEIAMCAQVLIEAAKVCRYLARHEGVPLVKWIDVIPMRGSVDFKLNASPLTPAAGLHAGLWSKVSAAICTSATMTACGNFDYYDRLTGLNRMPDRRSAIVESPFDYQKQGLLRVAPMVNNPKSASFSAELEKLLPELLASGQGGQLVLFTSKRQMNACYEALTPELRTSVLVQGQGARGDMLREHGKRVEAGKPSILFGLQSLGEGIDLPGNLCTHVIIDKLPFTPPTTPADAALAEWLESQGRDAFTEISVPKASMKLAQWIGRGIRTVSDRAVITICDTRLATTRYGQHIVAGLPNFPFEVMRLPGADMSAGQSPPRSSDIPQTKGRHFKRSAAH